MAHKIDYTILSRKKIFVLEFILLSILLMGFVSPATEFKSGNDGSYSYPTGVTVSCSPGYTISSFSCGCSGDPDWNQLTDTCTVGASSCYCDCWGINIDYRQCTWAGGPVTCLGDNSIAYLSMTCYKCDESNACAANTCIGSTCTGPCGETYSGTKNCAVSCNLPWGGTIFSGQSVTAYLSSSVACGSTCTSQTRTCNNGVLSGCYYHSSCSVGCCPSNACAANTCIGSTCTGPCGETYSGTKNCAVSCNLPWGGTISSGQSIIAYLASSVAYGSSCSSQTRTCNNGVLSGSYQYSNCSVSACTSCNLPWGGTISSGGSVTAYSTSSVPCGSTCTNQTRTCTNGILSGSYQSSSCSVENCSSCNLPWGGTIDNGASVIAYLSSSVPCGSTCTNQTRTCANGVLSGSYQYSNCSIQTGPYCGDSLCNNDETHSTCPEDCEDTKHKSSNKDKEEEVCYPNIQCSGWSDCFEGIQKRNCEDINSCEDNLMDSVERRLCEDYKTEKITLEPRDVKKESSLWNSLWKNGFLWIFPIGLFLVLAIIGIFLIVFLLSKER